MGNALEALREAAQDVAEGADMIMVKPGLPYPTSSPASSTSSACRPSPTRRRASTRPSWRPRRTAGSMGQGDVRVAARLQAGGRLRHPHLLRAEGRGSPAPGLKAAIARAANRHHLLSRTGISGRNWRDETMSDATVSERRTPDLAGTSREPTRACARAACVLPRGLHDRAPSSAIPFVSSWACSASSRSASAGCSTALSFRWLPCPMSLHAGRKVPGDTGMRLFGSGWSASTVDRPTGPRRRAFRPVLGRRCADLGFIVVLGLFTARKQLIRICC